MNNEINHYDKKVSNEGNLRKPIVFGGFSATALETTALVMYDRNIFFYVVPLFSYGSVKFINIHNI